MLLVALREPSPQTLSRDKMQTTSDLPQDSVSILYLVVLLGVHDRCIAVVLWLCWRLDWVVASRGTNTTKACWEGCGWGPAALRQPSYTLHTTTQNTAGHCKGRILESVAVFQIAREGGK